LYIVEGTGGIKVFCGLQTDQYCKSAGMEIVGYYQANESLKDNNPDFVASRIADKLAEVNPNILVLMVR